MFCVNLICISIKNLFWILSCAVLFFSLHVFWIWAKCFVLERFLCVGDWSPFCCRRRPKFFFGFSCHRRNPFSPFLFSFCRPVFLGSSPGSFSRRSFGRPWRDFSSSYFGFWRSRIFSDALIIFHFLLAHSIPAAGSGLLSRTGDLSARRFLTAVFTFCSCSGFQSEVRPGRDWLTRACFLCARSQRTLILFPARVSASSSHGRRRWFRSRSLAVAEDLGFADLFIPSDLSFAECQVKLLFFMIPVFVFLVLVMLSW
jgi:hypothetical protein